MTAIQTPSCQLLIPIMSFIGQGWISLLFTHKHTLQSSFQTHTSRITHKLSLLQTRTHTHTHPRLALRYTVCGSRSDSITQYSFTTKHIGTEQEEGKALKWVCASKWLDWQQEVTTGLSLITSSLYLWVGPSYSKKRDSSLEHFLSDLGRRLRAWVSSLSETQRLSKETTVLWLT